MKIGMTGSRNGISDKALGKFQKFLLENKDKINTEIDKDSIEMV